MTLLQQLRLRAGAFLIRAGARLVEPHPVEIPDLEDDEGPRHEPDVQAGHYGVVLSPKAREMVAETRREAPVEARPGPLPGSAAFRIAEARKRFAEEG